MTHKDGHNHTKDEGLEGEVFDMNENLEQLEEEKVTFFDVILNNLEQQLLRANNVTIPSTSNSIELGQFEYAYFSEVGETLKELPDKGNQILKNSSRA